MNPPPYASHLHTTGLVLVVDDQIRNLQMVKSALSEDGFEVLTASSGHEALICLTARTPDLILLDVIMPEIDGFEVCRQIKNNRATRDMPVIFLSGNSDHQSVIRAFETGGVDYVTKPFNKSELLARVRTHVELLQTQRRHQTQMNERVRTLGIIAEDWHQPLQRIALLTKELKTRATAGAAAGPGASPLSGAGLAPLVVEANEQVERMLLSVERFLQEQSLERSGRHEEGLLVENITPDIQALAGRWYLTAKRKCVDLRILAPGADPLVAASPFAVQQIVDALLSNAINFTPMDGGVEVHINRAGDLVTLTVQDSGPGFDSEYLERPFRPWVKPPERPGTRPSLGLGLAAAKRTADRIGAKLVLGNAPAPLGGARTSVIFHAPAAATSASPDQEDRDPSPLSVRSSRR
jgi:two-component system sensor histidine kinase/response regulator